MGKAIALLDELYATYAGLIGGDQFIDIKSDYGLMTDYWKKGYTDPQRLVLYERLLWRLYEVAANLKIKSRIDGSTLLTLASHRLERARFDGSFASIKNRLENDVSSLALIELEPEHKREQKKAELYDGHCRYMNDLFDHIYTSYLWSGAQRQFFEEILLLPTIDTSDQQLLVSAITLSLMNVFDIQKFLVLTTVYAQSADELVRQRALVGWAFCVDDEKATLYGEMKDVVAELMGDERCRQELTELQMQLVYCMQADDDSQKIKNEIMPDLMKGSNMQMTRRGLVELEESSLDDILHPEAAEKSMEDMEASMQKMADMQKRGSDIYFAGFSQMKRFAFFSDLSNWFVPFYPQHPGISNIWNHSKGQKFLKTITKIGAFCDSDKYSFVLAFDQIMSHLPERMLKMVEDGEASPMAVGGEVPASEQKQPAFMRRVYLQNLYRFFRVYPQRSEFRNPFEKSTTVVFAKSLFRGCGLDDSMTGLAAFYMKRGLLDEAIEVLGNVADEHQSIGYCLMMGHLLQSHRLKNAEKSGLSAIQFYEKAVQLEPSNEKAIMGYARALFEKGAYEEALQQYRSLQEKKPDDRNVELNIAVCLTNLRQYDEASKLLYKLNYHYPEDDGVTRVLAWVLVLLGKYDAAVKFYEHLLSSAKPQPNDMLNYAYCLWFKRDIAGAVSLFRQYSDNQSDVKQSLEQEFMVSEHEMIVAHGIDDSEIQLMLDAVS